MASDEGGEKTEQPTGHKLSKAREKGQTPKSQEVTTILVLLVAGLALLKLGPLGWDRLLGYFRHSIWRMAETDVAGADLWPFLYTAFLEALYLIIPFAFIIMVISVAANVYQLGGFLSIPLEFKIDKLNFVNGAKKFFKLKALFDTAKNILKIAVIFWVAYLVIRDNMEEFTVMGHMETAQMALFTLKVAAELFFEICLVLLVLAFIDFAYQKWQFMRDMRMSKQEVKDEYKQMEGDPKIKARIRQIQMETVKKRMLADVPKADVVIANPTHFAIALVYNAALAQAPLVLAKGQDLLAQRIKDIAKEAKVPIVENKPLAQALYKAVEVGDVIPLEFYKAVAEVLSYVYKIKGRSPRGRK
ncbi:MAG: flagellar biosynthesis protein FlhB [Candidatus Adiutrix sp.]|jgi:flagellar biosynthetic protein FlhB|nr:flagellar biosynthesis protein FlhB [Candidatus Adiutrix sp.]